MGIGVALELVLIVSQDWRAGVFVRNWALDQAMSFKATVFPAHDHRVPPLTVIDVDEKTWRSPCWSEPWTPDARAQCTGPGEPLRAPRTQLFDLIEYALERGARDVVVDVIVESRDDQADRDFSDKIKALISKPGYEDRHLLFVRTLDRATEFDPLPRWRPSPLDKIIDDDPNHLHAVAPYFVPSRDGVVRDWRLWRAACRESRGEWEARPSVQVLLAALQLPPHEQPNANQWAAGIGHRPCGRAQRREEIEQAENKIDGDLETWLLASDLAAHGGSGVASEETINANNRILYKYPRRPDPQLVGHVSALTILRREPEPTVMENAVVVIGQSFDEARDEHFTPLGMMPGSMIIANSVDSMISVGLLYVPSKRTERALTLFLIVVVGYFFARVEHIKGVFVPATLLQVPVWLLFSYFLLKRGCWWDYGVPIVGIGLDHLVSSFLEKPLVRAWHWIRDRWR